MTVDEIDTLPVELQVAPVMVPPPLLDEELELEELELDELLELLELLLDDELEPLLP
jgi:hypothetical protein